MKNVAEELAKLRQEIDRLDTILTDTLEKRMDVVQQVAAYKDERHMQVLDREREEQVIAKVIGQLKNPAYGSHMRSIMEKIMETSRNLQIDILADNIKKKELSAEPIRVGYQGVRGSFSHQALEDYFDGIAKVEMNFVHFEDVVVAVKKHEIKYGVLPIENSSTGGITEVYDLVRKYDCHIVGEKIIKVDQNLLALPGATVEGLRQVVEGAGVLFKAGDEHALADAVRKLLDNSGYYQATARRCAERAADYDIQKMVEQYLSVYSVWTISR